MATKGIFFVVHLNIEHNKVESMDAFGGPYHSAKEVREEHDRILVKTPPGSKRRIQIVQFVSV